MKKFTSILSTLIALLLSQPLIAQITLLHTFNELISWNGGFYIEQNSVVPNNCYYNTSIVGNSYKILIYNSDYSLLLNQTYNFNPPADYEVSSIQLSKKLFNDDENYEFMVTFNKIEYTNDNTYSKLKLLDHNGNVIKDFGTWQSFSPYPFLHIANEQFRLTIIKVDADGNYQTEIYSVPGEYSEVNESSYQFVSNQPFPNPSKSKVTLPYQIKSYEKPLMNIFNFQGMLIENLWLDSHSGSINLDVSNYTKGEYIYKVNGISKKFIVQ